MKVGDVSWLKEPNVIEEKAYRDTRGKEVSSYLQMIYEYLVFMKDLLAEDGSIYVHLDWYAGHYVKTIMDEIFQKENFMNEIVWHYEKFSRRSKGSFPRMHNTILFFSKTNHNIFSSTLAKTSNWVKKNAFISFSNRSAIIGASDEK